MAGEEKGRTARHGNHRCSPQALRNLVSKRKALNNLTEGQAIFQLPIFTLLLFYLIKHWQTGSCKWGKRNYVVTKLDCLIRPKELQTLIILFCGHKWYFQIGSASLGSQMDESCRWIIKVNEKVFYSEISVSLKKRNLSHSASNQLYELRQVT